MDTKGLKYFVYAKYASNAYSGGAVLGEAMSANATYTFDNAELYSNDALKYTDKSFVEGTLTYGLTGMLAVARADILGHTPSAPNDGFTGSVTDESPFVGTGFYGKTLENKYAAVFYPKVQFQATGDNMTTRQKTTTFNTPTIEGTIMQDDNGNWIMYEVFDIESDAVSWLNGKVGISDTPSTGLSALAVTGAGGTLSPSFGAAVRYYTFDGLTATSFTVTPTAAAHTIKMYVNGAYVQNVVSGQASAAIAMASVGTKKVTLVAFESGKASQTTEIVVVKTA